MNLKILSCKNKGVLGVYFIICYLVYFIDWNVVTLNGKSAFLTFLFDSMSFLFEAFVFIISSLVILHRVDSLQPESKNPIAF